MYDTSVVAFTSGGGRLGHEFGVSIVSISHLSEMGRSCIKLGAAIQSVTRSFPLVIRLL